MVPWRRVCTHGRDAAVGAGAVWRARPVVGGLAGVSCGRDPPYDVEYLAAVALAESVAGTHDAGHERGAIVGGLDACSVPWGGAST